MSAPNPAPGGREGAILAVTSGKGGVGKTSFSVNLGAELAGRGRRCVLVDGDLGLANAHILLGVQPSVTLRDHLAGTVQIKDVIHEGPSGLLLVPATGGESDMADLDEEGMEKVRDAIGRIQQMCDVVILDTGAGVGRGVTGLLCAAERIIVVTTPDFTSVADAYGVVKVVHQQGIRRPMHVVVNRVRSPAEAGEVFNKLNYCAERFLGLRLLSLGFIAEDRGVGASVQKRNPFLTAFPDSTAAKHLKKIAREVEKMISTARVS